VTGHGCRANLFFFFSPVFLARKKVFFFSVCRRWSKFLGAFFRPGNCFEMFARVNPRCQHSWKKMNGKKWLLFHSLLIDHAYDIIGSLALISSIVSTILIRRRGKKWVTKFFGWNWSNFLRIKTELWYML
jgi:hypothetical protein